MSKWNNERFKTVFASVAAAVAVYGVLWVIDRAVPVAFAQNDMFLSRRVDQMEQRFYSIESRLNRLEQEQTARPAVSPPVFNSSETEIGVLRSQVDSLRLRLGEAECALLRLDERTLAGPARLARGRSIAPGTDRCRLDPGRAVELSARP